MTAAGASRAPQTPRPPAATDPSIRAERVHTPGSAVAPYGASVWPLTPLGAPAAVKPHPLIWDRFPELLRELFRHAAWLLINTEAPEIILDKAGSAGVEWLSAGTIYITVMYDWLTLARWATNRGVQQLSDITRQDLELFVRYMQAKVSSRSTITRALRSITRLWAYAPRLPAAAVIPMPPWEDEPLSDFVTREQRKENTTPIVHPSTMAPLLWWSQRFLDLADDIMAAAQRWQSQLAQLPPHRLDAGRAAATALVKSWIEQGRNVLPAKLYQGRPWYDLRYLASQQPGIHPNDISTAIEASGHRFTMDLDAPTLIDSAISAAIDGQPWCEGIDYKDLPRLQQSVQGAALVVVTYLTGMRSHEVLALRPGCCAAEYGGGTSIRYTITGRKYKRVRRDGRSDPDGIERSWTTIHHVAKAISTIERAFPNETVLFSMLRDPTQALDAANAAKRIATLIETANALREPLALPAAYTIPADPAGDVSLRRFRRTLAWHIRRLPHGKIALAIQYGHLTVREGEGYASLKSAGFAALMEHEEVTTLIENIERTREEIESGAHVSGPAATRLLAALRRAPRFEGTFLNNAELARFKRDTLLRIYDNAPQYLTCMFDPNRAACLKGHRTPSPEPQLNNCSPDCANVARTDSQIAALQKEANRLRNEARDPTTPEPLARRLADRAAGYDTIAANHRPTAITYPSAKPEEPKT